MKRRAIKSVELAERIIRLEKAASPDLPPVVHVMRGASDALYALAADGRRVVVLRSFIECLGCHCLSNGKGPA